jgi:hypothetical protein
LGAYQFYGILFGASAATILLMLFLKYTGIL